MFLLALFAVLGCRPDPVLGPPSPARWVGPPPAVGVDVAVAHGGVGRAWIRSVNTFGASVPGEAITVQVDGLPTTVTLDASGFGELTLPTPGLHTIVADATSYEVASYGSDWPGLGGLARGHEGPARTVGEAVSAGGGILMHENNTVWWTSPEGFTHSVLVTNTPVISLRAGHLDGDGVLDAAVGTLDSVHVLRGRAEGGFSYVGHLEGDAPLRSFDLGDADDDGIADLAMIWQLETGDQLDVWRGDGFLRFRDGPNRVLVFPGVSIAVADAQGDGQQVSVSNEALFFDQFYANGPVFQPTGPRLEVTLPEDVEAWSPGDFDGNGLEELFFASPYQPGMPRQLAVIEIGPDPRVTTLDRAIAAHFTFADLTGEGWPDVLFAEDGGAVVAQRNNGGSTNSVNVGQTPGGPIGFAMGTGQFMIAEPERWMWTQVDPGVDRFLTIRSERLLSPGLSVRDGQYVLVDLDGDGVTEAVGLRPAGVTTELRTWSFDRDPDTGEVNVRERNRLQLLDTPQVVLDLAVCGQTVWVLHDAGLHQVGLDDLENPVVLGALPLAGRKIACGEGPNGPAVVLTDTTVIELDADLMVAGSQPSDGAQGVWLDEDGPAVCSDPGCGVVRVQAGSVKRTFIGSPAGASSDQGPVAGLGPPSLADVDGNGWMDVVFQRAGELTLYRNTPEGFGPVEFHVTHQPLQGPIAFADLDGDGFNDGWGIDPSTLRLRVTGALGEAPQEPVDTGDTGQPTDTAAPQDTGSDTGTDTATSTATSTGSTGDTGAP